MVCLLCEENPVPKTDGDCFFNLLKLLKAHYKERVEECHDKDVEIAELREALAKQQTSLTTSCDDSPASLDLFCETEKDLDTEFPVDDTSDAFLPGQKMPVASSPYPLAPLEQMETEEPQKENKIETPKLTLSPIPAKKRKNPLQLGWNTKPQQISFSALSNKTQICSPKKSLKTRTINDCWNGKPKKEAAKIKEKSKSPVAIIKLDDDDDDKDRVFTTPKRKPLELVLKQRKVLTTSPKSDDFDEFCENCKRYFTVNPPCWTPKERLWKVKECEGHKKKVFKGHETPPGFWDVRFLGTPDQMKTQIYVKQPKL